MTVRVSRDTRIALRAVVGGRRLAPAARQAILPADEVWVSVAPLWEIAIKHGLGRGDMPISPAMALQALDDAGQGLLVVRPEHVLALERLGPIHDDPFDRMQVAHVLSKPLTLITRDALVAG